MVKGRKNAFAHLFSWPQYRLKSLLNIREKENKQKKKKNAMQYNQAATYRVITSSIYNMRNHWFKVVEGKQKLINLKEVISKCRMVCSIYKQNQMRTMNSQDSNVVNNFN